jgi:hypothetical protein
MAIVSCSECSKPISDKVKICPHCSFDFSKSDPAALARTTTLKRLKRQNDYQMLVFASMFIFLVGVLFYYFGQSGNNMLQTILGYLGLGLGGLGYMLARVKVFNLKRQIKR